MENLSWYVSALGALALAVQLGSNVIKKDRLLMVNVGFAGVLWATYYGLLEAWTGASLAAMVAVRQAVIWKIGAENIGQKKARIVTLFCLAQIALGALSWHSIGSIFPIIGTLNATVAMFYLQGVRLRVQLILLTDLAWIIYDLAFIDAYMHAACLAVGIVFGVKTCLKIRSAGGSAAAAA